MTCCGGVAVAMPQGQTELGSSFVERITVNVGTVSVLARCRASSAAFWLGPSSTDQPRRGGAAVVLRAGGESRAHGEGRQQFREGTEL